VSDWAQIRAGIVLYEDDAALVLNKPAGLAVMGERHDTDLVRLAQEAGEKLYPAHRIDKVTSGALLLAVAGGLIAGSFGGWRAARLRPAAALARIE